MRFFAIPAAAVLLVAFAGCKHAPETRVVGPNAERVCQGDICYRTGRLPAGWRVVHAEGAAVGWFHDGRTAIIESNATCRDDAEATPLSSLTDHMLLGYTERRVRAQEDVMIDGRAALHTVMAARLDGIPVVLDLYVLKRNGCIFDLSYAAPPDKWADGRPDFDRFGAGFGDERAPHAQVRVPEPIR
jgi:hypothetical protein